MRTEIGMNFILHDIAAFSVEESKVYLHVRDRL